PRPLQRRRCRRSYAPLALPPPRPRTIARETPFRQQHAAFSVIRRTLFLLEAVCARSRVAGRGATDDIIHREHDVFNSPAWRGSVRSVAAHTLDPTRAPLER